MCWRMPVLFYPLLLPHLTFKRVKWNLNPPNSTRQCQPNEEISISLNV